MDVTSQNIKPIRILHVVGGMNRGGVETWLMHVLRHINRDHFRMDFLVHTALPCAYDEEIRSLGSKIIPCLSPSRPWAYARTFTRMLRKHGPYDVVHSHVHHYSGFVLRLAKWGRVPVRIAHSHSDTTALDMQSTLIRHLYLDIMKQWIDRNASIGLAASRQAGLALFGPNWESESNRRLLYCSVDLSRFRSRPDTKIIRADLGLSEDAFVVGHVGRFSQPKNHRFLIEIFSEIVKREPRAHLLLVGDGELRSTYEKTITSAGLADRVSFLGSRSDVPQIMLGAMDVFLFPSLYEGLGLALIEAQAAGLRAIIAANIPGEVDVVKPLLRRMSLSQSSSVWAEEVISHCRGEPVCSQKDALALVEQTGFTVTNGARTLMDLYLTHSPIK